MNLKRKMKTAREIIKIAGLKELWLAFNRSILRPDPRSDRMREHIRELNSRGSKLKVAEIGVLKGKHARTLQNQLSIKKMYLIDPYDAYPDYDEEKSSEEKLGRAKNAARNKLQEFENLVWIEQYSQDAVEQVECPLDYVYVDGNHEYQYVKKDIEEYYRLLKPGGIIAGHDFSGSWPGVVEAVTEFAKEENVEFHLEDFGTDWFIKKPDEKD